MHLLDNALKFSAADQTVTLSLQRRGDGQNSTLEIIVEDDGIGISSDDLDRVGERFYRVDTSGNLPGAGLGVALIKEITRLHEGTFSIQSAPAEGTRVTLSLPALLLDEAGKPSA
jgi:signal transduction histidine kinase